MIDPTDMTDKRLMEELEALQGIQKQHPPTSAAWQMASEYLAPLFREAQNRFSKAS